MKLPQLQKKTVTTMFRALASAILIALVAIANGGRFVRPRLVSALISNGVDSVLPVSYIRDRICSETNAARLRTMLKNVVWGNHGTGKLLRRRAATIR